MEDRVSVPKRRGRPSKYSEAIANEICDRLGQGEPLAAICRDPHLPSDYVVRQWAIDDRADKSGAGAGFSSRYARARQAGLERMADEVIAISDANYVGPDGLVDNGAVQQARLRIDSRRWLLSKMLPKQYGDRVTAEVVGDANAPVLTRIELVAVPARNSGVLIEHGGDKAAVTPPRACLLPRSGSAE